MPPKKKVAPPPKPKRVVVIRTEMVDTSTLKKFPGNARRGNVAKIKESLMATGQFKPVVANLGTKCPQAHKRAILAGNHTWLGVKELGWKEILVAWVDVEVSTAKRINLADNKLADDGSYDEKLLAELLTGMDALEGTGYSDSERDEIVALLEQQDEAGRKTLDDLTAGMPNEEEGTTYASHEDDDEDEEGGRKVGGQVRAEKAVDEEEVAEFDDASAELQGLLELKEEITFPIKNKWGIPELREDMLVTSIPSPIDTWGGQDATPDDGKTHWVWNYGAVSSRGLDLNRAILSFFTYDDKFENWWSLPAYYTAKMLNSGVKTAIVPDFSIWTDDPRALQLYNVYRAQWLGRYFQEAGIKVIPRVQFSDAGSLDYVLLGIPKNPPVVAFCLQTMDKSSKEDMKRAKDGVAAAIAALNPGSVLLYSGPPGREVMKAVSPKCKVVTIDNVAAKRRGVVYGKVDGKAAADKRKRVAARRSKEKPEDEE